MKNNVTLEQAISQLLLDKNLTVSIAESCTGGLISSRLTDVSGSSAYIKLNLITYSNEAKVKMLGVEPDLIKNYGAVSEQVALEMAKGARNIAGTDLGVGITGIAGPTGGTPEKPVGLVYIGIASDTHSEAHKVNISPELSRIEIKYQASQRALELLQRFIKLKYL
ncbi:MAG: hypothetical protein A2Y25_02925 [Candidatus Melainabacteria bacterium GWF2_37_15]|nr:MAG: hypothetical protein A2Y25_02925 [Candidatus Melainabacteria bacterium GWF2_37_15]